MEESVPSGWDSTVEQRRKDLKTLIENRGKSVKLKKWSGKTGKVRGKI